MSTFWAVMRTELRLAWRRRSFWIVQALTLLPVILVWQAGSYAADRTGLGVVANEISRIIAFELLLLPIVVGPAVTRDREELGEILWATPLDALVYVGGMFGGLYLALLPALLVQVGACWLVTTLLPGLQSAYLWTYGLPVILIGLSAGLGLVLALGLLLRRVLPLLIVWGAFWMVSFGLAGLVQTDRLTSPLNLIFASVQFSPALGLGLARPLVIRLAIWLLGIGLLGPILALAIALASDRRRGIRYTALLLGWALVGSLVAGGGYLIHAREATRQAPPISPADVQPEQWLVREQVLRATVDTNKLAITGTSTLTLEPAQPPSTSQVVLRLNTGMAVTGVRDGAGRALPHTRHGDGVVIDLPSPPTGPFTLHLDWEGSPRLPYTDYGIPHNYSTMSSGAPQPVRALLADGAGYLLRDGDWYPWPWTAQPHQAGRCQVQLQVDAPHALASAPLHNGIATWEGNLPAGLLINPPAGQYEAEGFTLYAGPLAGEQFVDLLRTYASAARTLWGALGEGPPPTHIVALPYFNSYIWSGDLLLVPEGSGSLNPYGMTRFYETTAPTPVEERAVLTTLAQTWLKQQQGLAGTLVRVGPNGPLLPSDPQGRWIERGLEPWSGGTEIEPILDEQGTVLDWQLSASAERDALALWIALELADPTVRDADLALFQKAMGPGEELALFRQFWDRQLPARNRIVQREMGAVLWALHGWSDKVGRAQALRMVAGTVQQRGAINLQNLFDELEQSSGIPLLQAWQELRPDPAQWEQ